MTRERAKELLPVIQAYADGVEVQYFSLDEWKDVSSPYGPAFEEFTQYRIKPSPKYKPWTFETCPVGITVREKDRERISLIVAKYDTGINLGALSDTYENLFEFCQQLDGTPCGTIDES